MLVAQHLHHSHDQARAAPRLGFEGAPLSRREDAAVQQYLPERAACYTRTLPDIFYGRGEGLDLEFVHSAADPCSVLARAALLSGRLCVRARLAAGLRSSRLPNASEGRACSRERCRALLLLAIRLRLLVPF